MRRNMSEEEKQKRIKVREFLKQNPISSPDDLNTFFKDMMKVMIEEFYQGELEEELGYMTIVIKILITQETATVRRNLKVALVKLKLMFPVIEMANMNLKLSKNIKIQLDKT